MFLDTQRRLAAARMAEACTDDEGIEDGMTLSATAAMKEAAALPLELAVIVPTLNERDNIPLMIAALDTALAGINWEVIFVDDGSVDGTPDKVAEYARHHRHIRILSRHGRRGLSSAVLEGALASAAPVVAVIDADMQHDESLLPLMLAEIREQRADLAIGSRYVEGGSVGEWGRVRHQGSRLATRLAQWIMHREIGDPMSGFFMLRREVLTAALPRLSGVGFKILLDLVSVSDPSLKIVELPYRFRGRANGESKMSVKVVAEYLTLIADKTLGRILPTRLILFLLVGALGLVVHLAVLKSVLLLWPGTFAMGQTLAVLCAIAFNFTLNNSITYHDRRLKGWRFLTGMASFYLVCSAGAMANIGVGSLVYNFNDIWWVAGVAGATVGAVWNYAASSLLTWKRA